ncbi:hypothetical protein JVT61DRAFT_9868 [Boletus reticuloceps]|uniref:Uncharacterized protein n=1 Tax=Boletus reticuloceps TaxID=495285 RepID=A0A8I3A4H2_9AGAM|nr:hypothetical protein JVT61DRAFT_12530 [Boletus reticuloceps]KAG6371243.1 hypothetical protein JVT61DRAFT_9868 [Boletus reticuloceps]
MARDTSICRGAVDFIPHSHPDKPTVLNNLGFSLRARFEHLDELSDLENAISTLRNAVDLTPDGHPYEPDHLGNLGHSFIIRFARFGALSDLLDAISSLKDAADLTPYDHRRKPDRLNNLGNSFLTRFRRLGDLGEQNDLEEAISMLRDVCHLAPHGHPDNPHSFNDLGICLVARCARLGERHDFEDANSVYSYAACSPIGPVSDRFHASHAWITRARGICHPSLLHAHAVAINLLQLAWIGLPLTQRFAQLKQGADVVREAAGFPETAVDGSSKGV